MQLTIFPRNVLTRFIVSILTSCFNLSASMATNKSVTYIVEHSQNEPNILKMQLNSDYTEEKRFFLRGNLMNVQSQVECFTCDGEKIKEENGAWVIPAGAHELTWKILLKKADEIGIDQQQSMSSKESILISEISSLPRFENPAGQEVLKVLSWNTFQLYPNPNSNGEIPFPKMSEPPFFALINYTSVGTRRTESIELAYLIDHSSAHPLLPDMDANLKGLEWLKTITDVKGSERFTVGWCGILTEHHSLSGVTGDGILLVNYLCNKGAESDKAVLLYVVLHEAFHQLQQHYPAEPCWLKESLASYYGIQALKVAMPGEGGILMDRFQKSGEHFKDGLLKTAAEIKNSNRSNYGAFYTKGISFWAQVDKALLAQQSNLNRHLKEILSTQHNDAGDLTSLADVFKLPNAIWSDLYNRFLKDNSESL
jgi:hypothetical protein